MSISLRKAQFALLAPNKNGLITLNNIRLALASNATEAMKESRIPAFLHWYFPLNGLGYQGMDYEEFCAASISVHQHESLNCWEKSVRHAYELFEMNKNRVIVIKELASGSQSLRILLQMLMEVESWKEALDYCKLIVLVYQSTSTVLQRVDAVDPKSRHKGKLETERAYCNQKV
ncbi:unnamed protein product [Eruca vesicaria subsp. sativa]|uniref:Uncharacterized protein n=1 Tax=Eruca vesicaria subsp. sativa TaxID=29727 RepID=A0ABC8JI18_ERUVS|nr:unnamed protein product [Eruca vesicaria subsp. sativa]